MSISVPTVGTRINDAPESSYDAWHAVLHDTGELLMSSESIAAELAASNARNTGEHAVIQSQLNQMGTTLCEIKVLLEKQNGRVRKAELDLSRLNLIVFSIGGSIGLAGIGFAVKFFGG